MSSKSPVSAVLAKLPSTPTAPITVRAHDGSCVTTKVVEQVSKWLYKTTPEYKKFVEQAHTSWTSDHQLQQFLIGAFGDNEDVVIDGDDAMAEFKTNLNKNVGDGHSNHPRERLNSISWHTYILCHFYCYMAMALGRGMVARVTVTFVN